MGMSLYHDGSAKVEIVNPHAHPAIFQGHLSQNGQSVQGTRIDRWSYRHLYQSVTMVAIIRAVNVGTASGIRTILRLEHSDVGGLSSTWSNLASKDGVTTHYPTRVDGSNSTRYQSNFDLSSAKRYLRVICTATHGADNNHTVPLDPVPGSGALLATMLVFTGGDQTPAGDPVADMGRALGNNAVAHGFE